MNVKTLKTWILLIACMVVIQATQTQSIHSQDEASAFIDPFNPVKPKQDSEKPAAKKGNSFFSGLSMPKMPNLNPFSKRKTAPPASPKKPNMFQQFGAGTKNFFTKTTHTIMPWTKPKPKPGNGAIVPAFMQNNVAEKKKSGIQLMNFFQPSQPKKNIATTGDFFKQERPGFRK